MMTTRELPFEEWSRLMGTDFGTIWQQLDPTHTRILVVEDAAGQIVGTWGLIRPWHVEGVWIHPSHQAKGSVGRRLLTTMRQWIRDTGATMVVTGSDSPRVDALLGKLRAQRVAASMWVWPMEQTTQDERDRERGARFHRQLETLLPTASTHEDDEVHDRAVGAAFRFAREWNPERARMAYNAWAQEAGYQPINAMRIIEPGIYDLEFQTQHMRVTLDGDVLRAEEVPTCQS